MDRVAEVLSKFDKEGNLAEGLSLEELTELDGQLQEIFTEIRSGEVEGVDAKDVSLLASIAEATQKVRARGEELKAQAAEADAKIAELAAQVVAETEVVVETPAEEVPVEVPAEEVTEEVSTEIQAAVEAPVVAEVKPAPLRALAAATRKPAVHPQVKSTSRSAEFMGADGKPMDFKKFADEVVDRRGRFGNNIPQDIHEAITVGTFKIDAPEERTLSAMDTFYSNDDKIRAVIDEAMNPGALVASGGFAAPFTTTYAIEVIAGTHRPVRDSLPRFVTDRGGLRFRKGISFASANALGATGSWTNTTDITPGNSTKATGTVSPDSITEVALAAVYRQLQFGNFRQRADAEGVAAWTNAVAAAWAATAETALLDAFSTNSTAVSTDQHLGVARDFLHQLHRAVAAYRSRNRMPYNAPLRVVLPQWLPDAIAVDWLESQAAENEFTALTYDDVLRQIQAMNVNVTLYSDTTTGGGQAYYNAPLQTAEDLLGWKSTAVWFLFHEGAYLFLDGGSLDLGIVRDSTLNKTNDYKLFAENFETVAYVGVESLKITTTVAVSGTAALAKDNSAQTIS